VILGTIAFWKREITDDLAPVRMHHVPGLEFVRTTLPHIRTLLNASAEQLISATQRHPSSVVGAVFDWRTASEAAHAIRAAGLQAQSVALSGNYVSSDDIDAFGRFCIQADESSLVRSPFDLGCLKTEPHPVVTCEIVRRERVSPTMGCVFSAAPALTASRFEDALARHEADTLKPRALERLLETYRSLGIARLFVVVTVPLREECIDLLVASDMELYCAVSATQRVPPTLLRKIRELHLWLGDNDTDARAIPQDVPNICAYIPVGIPGTSPEASLDWIATVRAAGANVVIPRWHQPLPNTPNWAEYAERFGIRVGARIGDPWRPIFALPGWETVDGAELLRQCLRGNSWSDSKSGRATFDDVVTITSCYMRNVAASRSVLTRHAIDSVVALRDGAVQECSVYPFFLINDVNPHTICSRAVSEVLLRSSDSGRLEDALRHVGETPGKQIRGLFLLALANAHDLPVDTALPIAVALELVHLASLIQDDLPCMDDDRFRRGQKSLHAIHGEACAILTSDVLVVLAIEQLLSLRVRVGAAKVAELIGYTLAALGTSGLIAGQMLDLEARRRTVPTVDDLIHAYRKKTGALFELAGQCVGVLAELADADRRGLAAAMSDIGLAFQIMDDAIDDGVGKLRIRSSDVENANVTLATLVGAAEARTFAHKFAEEAKAQFADAPPVRRLVDFVIARRA